MAEIIFFIAAIGAVSGAVGTITLRNPFYAVLALVGHLLSLAALFLLLRAEFVAAAQVVVYAGAVMVLYVFVVSYVGETQEFLGAPNIRWLRRISILFVAALLIELCIATLGSGIEGLTSEGTHFYSAFGRPSEIGRLLLTRFLLSFELASLLLLVAAVGAVVLARRRDGTGPRETVSVSELFRDAGPTGQPIGSMAEASGQKANESST